MAGRVKSYLQKRKHKKKMKEFGFPQPSIRERLSEKKRKLKSAVSARKSKKAAKKAFIGPPAPTARQKKKAAKFEEKGTRKLTQRGRQKAIGASKGTKVSRGAKSVEKTKGGEYVKYAKKSKAAGGFRSTFKAKCVGGASGFTWQGRSYSCAKASDKGQSKAKSSRKVSTTRAQTKNVPKY